MGQKGKSSLRFVLVCVLFMTSCGVVLVPLKNGILKQKVEMNAPENFPILVLTKGEKDHEYHPCVVYKKDLDSFLARNPQHALLVPEGEEQRLDQELSRTQDPNSGSKVFRAGFVVKRLADGKQSLKVEYDLYEDATNIGWYEATADRIFPKFHESHGDIGLLLVPAFLVTALIWVALFVVYTLVKRLRQRAPPQQSPA